MRHSFLGSMTLAGILALGAITAAGARAGNFETAKYYAGPRVWLGNLNGAVAIGGQVERGLTQPGSVGSGIISGGIGVDWYSWSYDYGAFGSYDYTVIPIQFFSNYHFAVKSNPKIDPYAGLALVYQNVNASWSGSGASSGFSASGNTTDIAGQAGVRYFLKDNFAIQGQVGFGYGTIGLGVTWKL